MCWTQWGCGCSNRALPIGCWNQYCCGLLLNGGLSRCSLIGGTDLALLLGVIKYLYWYCELADYFQKSPFLLSDSSEFTFPFLGGSSVAVFPLLLHRYIVARLRGGSRLFTLKHFERRKMKSQPSFEHFAYSSCASFCCWA